MKKRQNTSQGVTALRSTIAVMLMLLSAVLLSLAANPGANRSALPRSEIKIATRPLPTTETDTGSWTPTGSMTTARESHTTTLLPNGKVLVAGGIGSFPHASLNSAELYDPASGTWSATGSMTTARNRHTATLLPNGKVLVAGGASSLDSFTATAELYDPSSGTWSSTGSMMAARSDHTATLLPNGRVLVAGGTTTLGGGYGILSTAELYDPASGTWSTIGSMATKRHSHTATLLTNGKVLVAGGVSVDSFPHPTFLASAELYDPASGTWSTTAPMGISRTDHSATLLPNGRVMVAGGYNSDFLNRVELYDPASGTWSSTASLGTGRYYHTAALLPSGKVLVAGGFSPNGTDGGSSAEVYDAITGSWSSTGGLNTERISHTATLLPSGKILVTGGHDRHQLVTWSSAEVYDAATGSWNITGSPGMVFYDHTATLLPSAKVLVAGGPSELYDPAAGNWSSTGNLATLRISHTATLLPSGKVLVAGGLSYPIPLNSAELYDPATGSWSNTGSLHTARFHHTATLLPNGKVLVAGGEDNSAELYDPTTESWSNIGSLATGRWVHTATLLPSGKVLVAGGRNTSGGLPLSTAELYDPATGSWSNTGSLHTERAYHTATLLPSGKVLVMAGANNNFSALSSAELYDPATGSWSSTGSLATGRVSHTTTMLASGKVLVTGGEITDSGGPHALSSAELYDPATESWSSTASLGSARYLHKATLLPSGKVLVAGGTTAGGTVISAELYDVGLGFDPAWQPLLANVSPSAVPSGSMLTASGSRFKGISETSGGNGSQNSSSNYPVVQLLSLANEQTLFLPVDAMAGWSDSSFTSQPVTIMTATSSGFPVGYALVTVFTNGIPSQSQFVTAAPSSECTVCHKRIQTLVLPCNSMEYRRHLDHGDTIGACPPSKKQSIQLTR